MISQRQEVLSFPLKLQWKVVPWNDPANKPIHSRDNIIPLNLPVSLSHNSKKPNKEFRLPCHLFDWRGKYQNKNQCCVRSWFTDSRPQPAFLGLSPHCPIKPRRLVAVSSEDFAPLCDYLKVPLAQNTVPLWTLCYTTKVIHSSGPNSKAIPSLMFPGHPYLSGCVSPLNSSEMPCL